MFYIYLLFGSLWKTTENNFLKFKILIKMKKILGLFIEGCICKFYDIDFISNFVDSICHVM